MSDIKVERCRGRQMLLMTQHIQSCVINGNWAGQQQVHPWHTSTTSIKWLSTDTLTWWQNNKRQKKHWMLGFALFLLCLLPLLVCSSPLCLAAGLTGINVITCTRLLLSAGSGQPDCRRQSSSQHWTSSQRRFGELVRSLLQSARFVLWCVKLPVSLPLLTRSHCAIS